MTSTLRSGAFSDASKPHCDLEGRPICEFVGGGKITPPPHPELPGRHIGQSDATESSH